MSSSTTTASSSRSSVSTPSEADATRSWAAVTFTFPPCSSNTRRSPPKPTRPKSREPRPLPHTTSRVINNLPGFDDFAELVISSERNVPRVMVTPTTDMRSRRTHAAQRSAPSEPKQTAPIPMPTSSLPWSKEENEAGRVTFIFGRLRPSVARYAPSATSSPPNPNEPHRIDFVRRTSSQTVTGEETPHVQQPLHT